MTWETGTTDMDCPKCGATHVVEWTQYPARDEGTLKCQKCSAVLKEWRGTRDYHTATLK